MLVLAPMNSAKYSSLLRSCGSKSVLTRCPTAPTSSVDQVRHISRIPKWEYHIRFDASDGRKVPSRDVLERFKRLNNGMWIHYQWGRTTRRYLQLDAKWLDDSQKPVTCTKIECQMLDAMVTPYWLRPHYYPDDPYEFYHKRHNMPANTPRMDNRNKMLLRERRKVLLDDTTADKYFPR